MYLKAQNLQAAYYTARLQLEYDWMKTFLVALYGLCIKVHLNEVNAIICKKQGLKSISTNWQRSVLMRGDMRIFLIISIKSMACIYYQK